ncbi:serine hydrolase domain-containing protein [Sphingosinicella soli]|uniref:CubicO group peptidase (Beta-lactamase class C family) n=1 Tax=Sphingosinicella soli TaxID=333708 RepID=A0A7W7B3B2_9SPHN|nr:serine hydrolase domain-containing protein [Sphingosinicella soli]MBB4633251.1 CubicO group peptidase (beta-lactamase class C family) [Sphingosinicella soli]
MVELQDAIPIARRTFLAGAAAIGAYPAIAAAPGVQPLEDALRDDLGRLSALYATPGIAVALLQRGQPTRFLSTGSKPGVSERTVFQVGSISKLAAAIITLRLVDAGRIGFHEPVARYLRRWQLPPSAFRAESVTIARLLSHSAGISVRGYFPGSLYPGPVPSLVDSMEGRAAPAERVFINAAPGSTYAYSGGGYSILQVALEDLTGLPFNDLAHRELFAPLGMEASSFGYDGVVRPGGTRPHDLAGRAMPVRVFPNMAAAGLSSTAADLAILLDAVFGDTKDRPALLSPASRALLATATAPLSPPAAQPGFSQMMLAPETVRDPAAFRYGPGAAIAQRADGRLIVGHGGSKAGWKATAQYAPEGSGIVVLTNGEAGNGVILSAVSRWRDWLDTAAGAPPVGKALDHAPMAAAAAFARNGAAAAADVIRNAANAPGAWFVSDRSAAEAYGQISSFAALQGWSASDVKAAATALTHAGATSFPQSAFAQAAYALALAQSGSAEARQQLALAESLDADSDSRQLLAQTRQALGDAK